MAGIVLLLPGLVLLVAGLKLMSTGLSKAGGSAFGRALRRFTGNRMSAFLCGVVSTALTQSSSLTTVMVVGMVEARLLPLAPAVAVIIGANVGTTVTGQLLSFNLQSLALPAALAGLVCLALFPRRLSSPGRALAGLGLVLLGLETMVVALRPLARLEWFSALLWSAGRSPLCGVLAGALATALVQSSSAVMGMVLALAHSGSLTLAAGAALAVGADVGTCVTSLLAGLGTGKEARRAALAHLLFNLFSALLVLTVFGRFVALAGFSAGCLPRQIANAHTIYNLLGALVLLALLNPYVKLVRCLSGQEKQVKKRT
jgi:phosphate:Na+ symporter